MPELPEVHTTVTHLHRLIKGRRIVDYYKNQIKNPKYFRKFKKIVSGSKVRGVERRAKNILIRLDNDETILIHMKMTGHLLYGKYEKKKNEWRPAFGGPLQDPFNGWIRLVFSLDNGKHLALSDMRKFAKVTLENELGHLGPEPLEKNFTFKVFKEQLSKRPKGKIKTVLMNQEIIAGIGNIYSDEALWLSKIHSETLVKDLKDDRMKVLLRNVKLVLRKGIHFNGDSLQDYRRPDGTPGEFQKHHSIYGRKGEKCKRRGCKGIVQRKVVNGRSASFCPKCQSK
jgi:formamidopyrimidine-DNA glycosylase